MDEQKKENEWDVVFPVRRDPPRIHRKIKSAPIGETMPAEDEGVALQAASSVSRAFRSTAIPKTKPARMGRTAMQVLRDHDRAKLKPGEAEEIERVHRNAMRYLQRQALTVSHPNDPAEKEADEMADRVMRMPGGREVGEGREGVGRDVARGDGVQRSIDGGLEDEEGGEALPIRIAEEVSRKAATEEDLTVSRESAEQIARVTSSGGKPLENAGFFEERMGADFSGVRVHTGPEAAKAAEGVQAKAFTLGRDVVFGEGQYRPETNDGQRLIAHELTHTLQQGSATPKKGSVFAKLARSVGRLWRQVVMREPRSPTRPGRSGGSAAAIDYDQAVTKIIEALHGFTSARESHAIVAYFLSGGRTLVRTLLTRLKDRLAETDGLDGAAVIDWLFDDLTIEDRRKLKQHLLRIGEIDDYAFYLQRRLEDADSGALVEEISWWKGAHLDQFIENLNGSYRTARLAAGSFFHSFDSVPDREHVRTYFFAEARSSAAREMAITWTANRVNDLIRSGFSGLMGSQILFNFQRTPANLRGAVFQYLKQFARDDRRADVSQELANGLEPSGYRALQLLLKAGGYTLADARPDRETPTRQVNWLEIGGQILAGIGRGAAWGVLHLIQEVIAGAFDTVGLLADIAGALFYFLSGGRVFQDSVTRLKETLAGFQLLLSDPGAVLKAAWDELWLESEAIESDEIYEATAAYWARNITVFVISVVLFWRFILSARTKLRQALARARRLGKVDPVPEFTPEEKITAREAAGPEIAVSNALLTDTERALLDELVKLGVKVAPDRVIAIERIGSRIVFLETGRGGPGGSGLLHILERHSFEFSQKGITPDDIPGVLMMALRTNRVIGSQRGRPIYEIIYKEKLLKLAITVADNGYIVGANPR